MNLRRRLIKFFHLPDWEGFNEGMESWYERERAYGMSPEEEAIFRKKDADFLKAIGREKK